MVGGLSIRLIDPNDPAMNAKLSNLCKKYGLQPLIRDLELVLNTRPQKNRDFLKRFAMAWDIFAVPLRFFSDQATLDFSHQNLGLEDSDYSNHCKRVHKGGVNRQEGLRLASQKPHIVTQWAATIRFDVKAAEFYGFPVERAIELLRMFSKKKVCVI